MGQISTPSLPTNALGRPAIWAGPRGYSNIQSEEETEAATAAGGAATKRGGSGGANNPLPHPALVPWEDAGWSRVARECARACLRACVRVFLQTQSCAPSGCYSTKGSLSELHHPQRPGPVCRRRVGEEGAKAGEAADGSRWESRRLTGGADDSQVKGRVCATSNGGFSRARSEAPEG